MVAQIAEQAQHRPAVARTLGWAAASPRVRAFAPYAAAGASYVAIGAFFTQFMLSWIVAFAWLELWVWLLPAGYRRLSRRSA